MKKNMMHVNAAVHDPSIFVDKDEKYYIFGSHMAVAKSTDLKNWEMITDEENPLRQMFDNIYDPEAHVFDFVGSLEGAEYNVWTPDVSFNSVMNKYVMYFTVVGDGAKTALCMATSDNVTGPYHYEKTIRYSGFNRENVSMTNVGDFTQSGESFEKYLDNKGEFNHSMYPKCVDPNTFRDRDGNLWLVYGSMSGGVFLLQIDETTGEPFDIDNDTDNQIDSYFGKRILGGQNNAIEGPYIIYDKVSDYYFLFVSFGKKDLDGHQIRLFRSKKVDGAYVDMTGKSCTNVKTPNPYGLKLVGSYQFPSMSMAYWSPGHNSCFIDSDDRMYMVYHQRFEGKSVEHEPRAHQLFRTESSWLCVCPFATEGEMLINKTYHESEIYGTYYMIEHGTDVSDEIHKAVKVEVKFNGEILRYVNQDPTSGDILKESEPYATFDLIHGGKIKITRGNDVYKCVIVQLNDEASNPTMCFTGCTKNKSLWAVRYL